MLTLIRFKHGLGDCLSFTVVVRHLKHYFPDWDIVIETQPERFIVFEGLGVRCTPLLDNAKWNRWEVEGQKVDNYFYITYGKPQEVYYPLPSTKPTRCLYEAFQLDPIQELYKYHCGRVETSLLAGERFGLLHSTGISGGIHKNLLPAETTAALRLIERHGLKAYQLEELQVDGIGELFDLISRASLFVGIDSGPLHLAGATNTPCIGLWTGFAPYYNIEGFPNQLHIVPDFFEGQDEYRTEINSFPWQLIEGEEESGCKYRHEIYSGELLDWLEQYRPRRFYGSLRPYNKKPQ